MSEFAKVLRTNQTDAEKRLWYHFRNRRLAGYKFRRQYPIGPFIVDFICLDQKLIIEIDGGQHALQSSEDERRTEFLVSSGYRVIRFWNNEVLLETDAVLTRVLEHLQGTPLTPTLSP